MGFTLNGILHIPWLPLDTHFPPGGTALWLGIWQDAPWHWAPGPLGPAGLERDALAGAQKKGVSKGVPSAARGQALVRQWPCGST